MIFNALGEIIEWIFVHDGTYLPNMFTIDNAIDVSSLKTSDGVAFITFTHICSHIC